MANGLGAGLTVEMKRRTRSRRRAFCLSRGDGRYQGMRGFFFTRELARSGPSGCLMFGRDDHLRHPVQLPALVGTPRTINTFVVGGACAPSFIHHVCVVVPTTLFSDDYLLYVLSVLFRIIYDGMFPGPKQCCQGSQASERVIITGDEREQNASTAAIVVAVLLLLYYRQYTHCPGSLRRVSLRVLRGNVV